MPSWTPAPYALPYITGQDVLEQTPSTNEAQMRKISQYLEQIAIPVGIIAPFMGENAPNYWLLCDGSEYNPDDLPELYAVNDAFHINDSPSKPEFRVPDLRGRAPVGASDAKAAPNPDSLDNAVKRRNIGARYGYWTLADHTHLAPGTALGGDAGLGTDTYAFLWDGSQYGFTTHWYHRVNDAAQLTKQNILEPQDPATVVNFIVYAGRPTAGIMPVSDMPGVTARIMIEERLSDPNLHDDERSMLEEQLASL